jgi:hypothetical protein
VDEDALRLAALVIGVRVVEGMAEGVLAEADEELVDKVLLGIFQVSTTAGVAVGELLGELDGSCIGQPCELHVQRCEGRRISTGPSSVPEPSSWIRSGCGRHTPFAR